MSETTRKTCVRCGAFRTHRKCEQLCTVCEREIEAQTEWLIEQERSDAEVAETDVTAATRAVDQADVERAVFERTEQAAFVNADRIGRPVADVQAAYNWLGEDRDSQFELMRAEMESAPGSGFPRASFE